ncbi:MAG: glycoside hydrolase family protein [Synechococcales bacterium]|nr:glycoside hydrolase family protein [Synechococcales bacterium]
MTFPARRDRNFNLPTSSRRLPRTASRLLSPLVVCALVLLLRDGLPDRRWLMAPLGFYNPPPLVMEGGDPYLRALMRTIAVGEANYPQPYSILYGGIRFDDLSQHPDRCMPIVAGPNVGNCTTAAGRYQFLSNTWKEVAEDYHPQRSLQPSQEGYSFEPQYQDAVVYAWLADENVWGTDLAAILRSGDIERVFSLLSGTWTSLGYGSETNIVSPYLSLVYRKVLREELKNVN